MRVRWRDDKFMKTLSLFSIPFLIALGSVSAHGESSPYPDEVMNRVLSLKALAEQKKEMPPSLPGITLVSTGEAREIWKSKRAIFLDTRTKAQYDAEKIEGAEWFLSDDLLKNSEAAGRLDKGKEYVLYCNGDRCWRAAGVALMLDHLGFKKILWYREGLPGWKKENVPTEKVK